MANKVRKVKNCDLVVQLRDAIKKRNKRLAKRLLLKNSIVEGDKLKSAHTLTHWAILKFEDVEILKVLIDQGANVFVKNYRNQTPLRLAIEEVHLKAVKLLLTKKAYVGENFKTLLAYAINTNYEKLVKLLVNFGVKNKLFAHLNESLDYAVTKRLPQMVKIVIPYCKMRNPKKQISEATMVQGDQKYFECVDILLRHGFTMEPACKDNSKLVFGTVKNGHMAIMKKLSSLGVDVNMVSQSTGLSLLQTACISKQYKIAELLLRKNADVNAIVNILPTSLNCRSKIKNMTLWNRKTALVMAVEIADSQMLELLLKNGATIDYDPDFIASVSRVIHVDHLDVLQVLINHKFDVNAQLVNGKTLLHEAAKSQSRLPHFFTPESTRMILNMRLAIARMLLENGANIEAQGIDRETALFIALKNNFLDMVQLLLRRGANANQANIDGDTPLHIIAQDSSISPIIVDRILKQGVDVNKQNNFGNTPFHYACSNWSSKMVKILIDLGADVELIGSSNSTSLHFAAKGQHFKVIELLLKKGIDVHSQDRHAKTPLHILCNQFTEPSVETLELFLKHGADINAVDSEGRTPLFYACKRGTLKTVKMLLSHHAKVNHVDVFGQTPVYVAADCSERVVKFLLSRKTTLTSFVTEEGKTLLHALVEEDRIDIIEQYMNVLKVHINTPDNDGKTPLFYAATEAQEQIVVLLLQNGADVNIADNENRTIPMHIHSLMIEINLELTKILHRLQRDEHANYFLLRRQYYPQWEKLKVYKGIMHLLREKLLQLKSADLSIHPKNVHFSIYNQSNIDLYNDEVDSANLEGYELLCEIEVIVLHTTFIPDTDFCLYDILMLKTHILANHCHLEKVKLFVKQEHLRNTFPKYIDLIRHRVSKALSRKNYLNLARIHSESTIFFGLPATATHQIFSYIDNNDVKNFNQAVGVVKFMNQSERHRLKVLLQTGSTDFLREFKPVETADSVETKVRKTKKAKKY